MYSSLITQNEGDLYQAAGYSPMASQVQAQPTTVTPPPATATPAQEPAKGPDMWQQLGSLASGNGGQQQPVQMRPSAYSAGVQPDAPQTNTQAPMKGRAGKIMEIVGAIMSMGATKAASQAQKNGAPQSDPPAGG